MPEASPTLEHAPQYHTQVERSDWTAIIEARRRGVAWDQLRTRAGLSALGQALLDGRADIVERLLLLGAPVHTSILFDGTPFSPLWTALRRSHADCLGLVLAAGADPNAADPETQASALMEGCIQPWADGVLRLLKAGARPNTPHPQGTALHLWLDHVEHRGGNEQEAHGVLLALIQAGADLAAPHQDGRTALERLTHMAGVFFNKPRWQELSREAQALASQSQSLHLAVSLDASAPHQESPRRL